MCGCSALLSWATLCQFLPFIYVIVVESLSHVWLFATPWTAACRLPCPWLAPEVCSKSCPLSCWCHPTISSSVAPYSSCLQSFPASGSLPMSWLFTSGGQSIGNSASVCPPNEHSELMSFRIDWFDLLALQVTLKNFPQHQFESTNSLAFFMVQLSLWFTFPYGSLSHPSMDTGKNIALTRWTFIG